MPRSKLTKDKTKTASKMGKKLSNKDVANVNKQNKSTLPLAASENENQNSTTMTLHPTGHFLNLFQHPPTHPNSQLLSFSLRKVFWVGKIFKCNHCIYKTERRQVNKLYPRQGACNCKFMTWSSVK